MSAIHGIRVFFDIFNGSFYVDYISPVVKPGKSIAESAFLVELRNAPPGNAKAIGKVGNIPVIIRYRLQIGFFPGFTFRFFWHGGLPVHCDKKITNYE
jgi:hypothetical protein